VSKALSGTLSAALERCRTAAKLSDGKIMIGLSGGKDSLATLDVVMRCGAFSRVEAFAMYLVDGLETFEAPVRAAAARYGIPVHFVPHFELSRLLKVGVLRMHLPAAQAPSKKLSPKNVEQALTHQHGIDWFAYGERASDSIMRAINTMRCDGVEQAWKRLWPIYDWKTAQVLTYLAARRIPVARNLWRANMDGVSLHPLALAALKKRCPSDYAKVLKVFPMAEGQVFRVERGDFNKPPKGKKTNGRVESKTAGEAEGEG